MKKNKFHAIGWLKAAKDDLDAISYLIKVEHLTNIVAFHSQQVIEKSFKAVLEYYESPLIKTHNLEKLYKQIKNFINIDIDYEKLEFINEFYIDSRYPADFGLLPYGKPTLKDAQELYDFCERSFL